jgi:hypothetical protein
MISQHWHRRAILAVIGLGYLFLLAWVPGCAKTIHTDETSQEGAPTTVTIREFPDVPIPKELDLDEGESFIYAVPEMSTGLLVYSGNVDYDSLVKFFDENLTKSGWELRASLKYPRTMFFYQKETRVCLITIKAGTFRKNVEIWVAPLELPGFQPLEPVMP